MIWGTRLKEDWKELGVKSIGDGATRSRIEDGWHPNWERARRKEKGRTKRIQEHSGFNMTSKAADTACEGDYSSAEDFELDYFTLARWRERDHI